MKNYEVVNATLDEKNMCQDKISQVELDIMLECDDYNDMMFIQSLTQYDVLTQGCEE